MCKNSFRAKSEEQLQGLCEICTDIICYKSDDEDDGVSEDVSVGSTSEQEFSPPNFCLDSSEVSTLKDFTLDQGACGNDRLADHFSSSSSSQVSTPEVHDNVDNTSQEVVSRHLYVVVVCFGGCSCPWICCFCFFLLLLSFFM